jgi:hypothetical protein
MKNAFSDLFQSRKFWVAVCDAVFSTLAVMLTLFFKPEVVDKILAVVAMWQPVILVVIGSMTVQNVAGINATAKIEDAKIYADSEARLAAIKSETPKP